MYRITTSTLVLAIIFISTTVFAGTCGPNFPTECICGKESYELLIRYVVNCTNAGLTNTSILEFMPPQVEILIFTGNNIETLPWNVFGTINDYLSLEIVDMSNNHIREIRGKAYHHVPNVKRLILNHNNLSISRDDDDKNHHHPRVFSNFLNLEALHLTDAFDDNTSPHLSEDLHDIFVNSNLTKLQKLHLEQNEITHFKDRKVFCDLPHLRDLHLGDNDLRDINFDVKCLKNLRFLDLERNKFEYVKAKDLILLDELENRHDRSTNLIVDFNLNPFVCDCRISVLHDWIMQTTVTVRNKENLMCFRNHTKPEPIMEIQYGKCASSKLRASMTGHTMTLIFLLVVLSMILIALVAALIYVSRDRIKYMITPVFDTVSKKVHYTTIKDEDCPEVHV